MNTTLELNKLLAFARQHSTYYARHWQGVKPQISTLDELPPIDPQQYWASSNNFDQWPVLTSTVERALVFKTGGTTSAGKLSVFTREEWQTLVRDFGRHLASQLNPGDRVANLFFVGDLYASFIFIHDALAHETSGITEYPFTGDVDFTVLADSIRQHRINVLAGVPAQLLTFASVLERQGQTLVEVESVLYGGESLFAGQLQMLHRVFPNARIASIGYASVDAGFIGATSRDCALGEHRMLASHSVLEIIDEHTGEVIEECDRTGRLLITNLTRRLMPLIRYPVGDLACWREPATAPMRKFALMGRSMSSQRVRVSSLTLLIEDIDTIIQRNTVSDDWQLVISQSANVDILCLKWVPEALKPETTQASTALQNGLIEHYPLIAQLCADGQLELQVAHCTADELARHPRSGKRQRVVDLRDYNAPRPEQRPWTT
ncbi:MULTISPECIES: phenylacetate--CoA ligase family protein [unclassified Pseudomonas]|jgi:phenylacetate-CoA ligase|uniref:phenylacetate--CoA ligase family protein n=1 Tax=unclassified Pseudomonas TaxID=196821 RepID=UPI00131F6C6D|nr:AMP-binding protein [Pseudomonas sp. R84]QHC95742.1 AMP-dependent synthetase [Pseudomonas sp. R84]